MGNSSIIEKLRTEKEVSDKVLMFYDFVTR
jgi:hypothetical protein